jgi:menaquinone-dependent protoporphyrinogen IX oxidase
MMSSKTFEKEVAVLYYSNTGNNRFIAQKIATSLSGDLIPIVPKTKSIPILIFQSWLRMGRIHEIKEDLSVYQKIILCGPIWTGLLISPLRSFLKKYKEDINQLVFVTSCGSKDEEKDNRFGYASIFKEVEKIMGDQNVYCEAFPIALIIPKDKLDDADFVMNARLTDESFTGAIQERFHEFIRKVESLSIA